MQGELVQIISLTSYGNEYIHTGKIPDHYFPESTVFPFCNLVDFINLQSDKKTETISAHNPFEWFPLLKKEGCVHLRLYYEPEKKFQFGPEYNLAGFVGGAGTWLIEANYGSYSHYWQKSWQVTAKDSPDKKIWSVHYSRLLQEFAPTNQKVDIDQTKSKLSATLDELIAFCQNRDLDYWLKSFEKAKRVLSSSQPNKEYYHHDLLVLNNYSLPAQQLLFAAGTAWVFGGMGWWNDMGFEDDHAQETYLRLTQQLYDGLLQSILASTNSF